MPMVVSYYILYSYIFKDIQDSVDSITPLNFKGTLQLGTRDNKISFA